MFWKEAFDAFIRMKLGRDYESFCACFDQYPPVSIRIHPDKYTGDPPSEDPVPWCPQGYYLSERPVFTLDPVWHAGGYYVQEASSMFLDHVLRQLSLPAKGANILDMCAAPGGKSTLLANYTGDEGGLIANEVIGARAMILRENMIRWGHPNAIITRHDPEAFSGFTDFFDIALVDAPCSGEGLFRKDKNAAASWSSAHVALNAARQKRILMAAAPLVRPGGYLIYSTCTYNDSENRDNARWLAEQTGWEPFPVRVPAEWSVVHADPGYQFFPHRVKGEGFYLVVFQKPAGKEVPASGKGSRIPFRKATSAEVDSLKGYLASNDTSCIFMHQQGDIYAFSPAFAAILPEIYARLQHIYPLARIGTFKGRQFIPAHELALRTDLSQDIPSVHADLEQSLQYLRRTPVQPEFHPAQSGWHLVRYGSYPLGWIKAVPGRINNYYPQAYRIRLT